MEPSPTWHTLDTEFPSLISEIQIDRGRAFELDRVDVGRATITMKDVEGVMDPTNPFNPFLTYGDIVPLKQARIAAWNPVTEDWFTRYRGFIESYEYDFDPSQRMNVVTINLVDIFEIVSAVEMYPGFFGDPAPNGDVVFFEDTATSPPGHGMQLRVTDILENGTLGSCGIPSDFYQVFSGNVELHESSYSPGESAMTAIQEAVDAEFVGVGSVYVDRLGRLAVHGRFARFDPIGTAAATGGVWDFQDWYAGDGAAVAASPTDTAHIRAFSYSRDLAKIINHAMASPVTNDAAPDFEGQVVEDATSKGLYGIRAWSTQNLITRLGVTDGNIDDWAETKKFAEYYVLNYAAPANRITTLTVRSSDLRMTGTAANWDFMCRCDLNDRVTVTIGSPGGGGFTAEPFFIEGIHETIRPMNDTMDDVTVTLDVSPGSYFQDNPFST